MEISKHYKIIKWCKYEEVATIGDVSGMNEQPNYGPVNTTGGHIMRLQCWLNDDTDEGWEIRTYQVKEN